MKCYQQNGCHNPNRCGDNGECYWKAFHETNEARRGALERDKIPDADVVAFGCTLEAGGNTPCKEWCHESDCPVALSAETVTS